MKEAAGSGRAASSAGSLPVTVLTGFLGSGKTTLLNRLLRSPQMNRTLVIVNEFGEVGLDHLMVETPEDEAILLSNGCLCCSVLGDLVVTLTRLLERRAAGELSPFDRVVVETTGLADPVPLLRTVLTEPALSGRFGLDQVVTVVDAVNSHAQLRDHPEAIKQVAAADGLVLSKADLVSAEAMAALRGRVGAINPGARLFTAVEGVVKEEGLLSGSSGRDWEAWLGDATQAVSGAPMARAPDHSRHHVDDGIRSFTVRPPASVTRDGLKLWLNALSRFRGADLLRVKGILDVEGKPVVVQAVQHLVHEPRELGRWPDAGEHEGGRIVFITRGLAHAQIEATLPALDFRAPCGSAAGLAFDGADYGRFVAVLQRFGAMDRL